MNDNDTIREELLGELASMQEQLVRYVEENNRLRSQHAANGLVSITDVIKAVDAEPEPQGILPDSLWDLLNGDREATSVVLIGAVAIAKSGIRRRIQRLIKEQK